MKEKIYLIDGTALIYRSYFAFIRNPLRDSSGQNTGAIFGVANTCLKFFAQKKPSRMMVSFDLKEPTFRHKLDDTYKANRPPPPDDLISQIEPVKELFKLLNIPDISFEGFEADDVIATLAESLKGKFEVIIVTGDKDFCQIVDDNISLYDPFSEKTLNPDDVEKKYGITTTQFRDYLAIVGDSADNIPGIRGLGPKGAVGLLQEFSTLDQIYDNLEKISSPSQRKKLEDNKDAAYLSQELVTLVTDVPLREKYEIEDIIENLHFDPQNFKNLIAYIKRFELNSLFKKMEDFLQNKSPAPTEDKAKHENTQEYGTKKKDMSEKADEQQTIDELIASQRGSVRTDEQQDSKTDDGKMASVSQQSLDFFSEPFDYDTKLIDSNDELKSFLDAFTAADAISMEIVTEEQFSISAEDNPGHLFVAITCNCETVYYFDISQENMKSFQEIDIADNDIENLRKKTKTIVGHNIKEKIHTLRSCLPYITAKINDSNDNQSLGLLLKLLSCFIPQTMRLKTTKKLLEGVKLFDTMIASYLIDANNPLHNLPASVNREFHQKIVSKKELDKELSKNPEESSVLIRDFAVQNCFYTMRLYERFEKKINNYAELFHQVEMPLTPVLAKMEQTGVYIDVSILDDINKEISEEIDTLTTKIHSLAEKEFNINSPKQLSEVLFEDMNISPLKKTKTGYSTDNVVLEKLAESYEIAEHLIDYRQLTKLRSTYVEALPELIDKETERIHSTFNQTVTSTGRLSSSNPNLQNIPIRSKVGKLIRKAFMPTPADLASTVKDSKMLILSADYSQIELRLLGVMSKDRNLITAFNNNQDIHSQTAGLILGKPITTISQDERRMAKTINFGILYGMGAVKLSKEINVSQKEAKQFIEEYFRKFPKIKDFIHSLKSSAKSKGYAETIMGRRLYLPNIQNSNPRYLSEAERVAVNMPIQGSAADIIKVAMIRIDKRLTQLNNKYLDADTANKQLRTGNKVSYAAQMIVQVHDELVFEVAEKYLEQVKDIVVSEMKYALPEKYRIIIPLAVDIGTGINWYEAHE